VRIEELFKIKPGGDGENPSDNNQNLNYLSIQFSGSGSKQNSELSLCIMWGAN